MFIRLLVESLSLRLQSYSIFPNNPCTILLNKRTFMAKHKKRWKIEIISPIFHLNNAIYKELTVLLYSMEAFL